jgi:uncharacterized protein with FMN-binding domain
MRKGIVIIAAVAIIGVLGIYSKGHKSDSLAPTTSSSGTATTLGSSTSASSETTNPSSASGSTTQTSGTYKNGIYTGAAENTEYGTVQVAAVVSGGKITDIKFLQMPGPEGHSKEVTAFSESPLKQSALSHQSASVDFVSGATTTSQAYEQSLQVALDQAA